MHSLDEARSAKEKIKHILEKFDTVVGVGITRNDDGYGLKVNLRADAESGSIPQTIDGVPVEVEVVGAIVKRTAD